MQLIWVLLLVAVKHAATIPKTGIVSRQLAIYTYIMTFPYLRTEIKHSWLFFQFYSFSSIHSTFSIFFFMYTVIDIGIFVTWGWLSNLLWHSHTRIIYDTNYISSIWNHANEKEPTIFTPEHNGWRIEENHFNFHWFDGDQLPGEVSESLQRLGTLLKLQV